MLPCLTVTWAKPVVQTGLEVLRTANYSQFADRKVLVLSNPTGVTPELDLGVDAMFNSGAVNLVGVMGPEHGFRGTAQAGGSEGTFKDAETGLTVYVSVTPLADTGHSLTCELAGCLQRQHIHLGRVYHRLWRRYCGL